MLKRILCVFLSICIVFSVCVVSVSADDYSGIAGITQNDVDYFKKALDLAQRLVKGEISVEDAYAEFQSNATELVSENVKDLLHLDDVSNMSARNLANEIVKAVRDKLKDLGGLVNGSPQKEDNIDMKGYSSVAVKYWDNTKTELEYIYYGHDGELYSPTSDSIQFYIPYSRCDFYDLRGNFNQTQIRDSSISSTHYYSSSPWVLYGDWKMRDGSDVPDDATSPTYNIVYTTDPSGLTDLEILDLIEDMINQLKLDIPDLSTIEGLLSAILSKLGTLDSDNDAAGLSEIASAIDNLGSKEEKNYSSVLDEIKSALENLFNKEEKDYTTSLDNINSSLSKLSEKDYETLLNQINAAIVTLGKDNHTDNQQIITALNDLKSAMSNGSKTDISPIVSQLEKMQKSLDYLCTINTLEFGENVLDDLTEEESKFLNEYAVLITTLLSKFGLVPINNMLASLDAVILNNSAPADLVINMYGQDITFLSSKMFNAEAMQYINLAKIFISVLLVYSFCLMFRKKIVGGG